MQPFYATRPNFLTTVNQLPYTRAQDAARAFIPNGDQIIGKGLERIVITKEDPTVVWPEIKTTLERESASVVRQLRAIEG
jgi:sn-glycerol 3-phosphate transport system substrate-binding protein